MSNFLLSIINYISDLQICFGFMHEFIGLALIFQDFLICMHVAFLIGFLEGIQDFRIIYRLGSYMEGKNFTGNMNFKIMSHNIVTTHSFGYSY